MRGVCLAVMVTLSGASSVSEARAANAGPDPYELYEAGLALGKPAALADGLATGVELLYTRGTRACWGARLGWLTTSEYPGFRTVRHDEIRARLTGALRFAVGRAQLGLRLGLGVTTLYEDVVRTDLAPAHQAPSTSDWRAFLGSELEATVVLPLYRGWGVAVSGGPAFHLDQRDVSLGWTGGLRVAWQP